jgi:hypothetical protein
VGLGEELRRIEREQEKPLGLPLLRTEKAK